MSYTYGKSNCMRFFSYLFTVILIIALALYAYIEKRNRLTSLRIEVPILAKKLKTIEDENTRLTFEIEKFENPLHLMELLKLPQYSHLKHPYTNEIVTIEDRHEAPKTP
jgi:hypothetical protein